MKEIKFRLWCKDLEEIIEVNKMGFENNKLWYVQCIDHDKELLYFPENNDHVLMQYTGIKDKNCKEIYEGDIVKSLMQESRGEWKDFERIGDVTYFENYAQFLIRTNDNSLGYDLFQMEDTDEFEILELEVIGNIYENPELLAGETK